MTTLAVIDASQPPIRPLGELDQRRKEACQFLGLEPGDLTTLHEKALQLLWAVMDKPAPTVYIAKIPGENGATTLMVQ